MFVLCRPVLCGDNFGMARKRKRATRRSANDLAQLKVRLPEPLRRQLMYAAQRASHSMNVEIVNRLNQSFLELDRAKIIANALVRDLDDEILNEIDSIFQRQRRDDYLANDYDDTLEREAERAGDLQAELAHDIAHEGGSEEEELK
jgi:hypothetical protein